MGSMLLSAASLSSSVLISSVSAFLRHSFATFAVLSVKNRAMSVDWTAKGAKKEESSRSKLGGQIRNRR